MDILQDLNFAEAKSIIDTFVSKHGQTERLPPNSVYVMDGLEDVNVGVCAYESASYSLFRLETQADDEGETKEITLYTIGVLGQKLLPPFKPKRKYYSGRDVVFKSFRQSVTLHGAGASPLTDAVECAKFAFVLLERNAAKASSFPSDRVSDENFVVANPYFETGEDAKGKEHIPFTKLVDPFDDLNRHRSDGCVHTMDNVVQYLEGFEDDDGVFRHSTVTPSRFRAGDIVRVGFAIRIKQDNAHNTASSELTLVLRSVTLIDDTLSTALSIKQLNEPKDKGKKRATASHSSLSEETEERPMLKMRKAMSKLSIRGPAMDIDKSAGNGGSSSSTT